MSATSLQGSTQGIRVLVADDHPTFREGLSELLRRESDLEVVAAVATGSEAVTKAREQSPDVVIIDIAMPDLDGIEATRMIKAECPDTMVVVLTAYNYEAYVFGAIDAGASAYLMKTRSLGEIVGAIRAVRGGEVVLDSRIAKKVFGRLGYGAKPLAVARPSKQLRESELAVLRLAAQGLNNKAIATELGISRRTIESRFLRLSKRLGVTSRTEVLLCALKEGWISSDDLG